MPLAARADPYLGFRFLVEIEGLIVGGFSEVSGLQAETEFEEVREGGVNHHVHKLPKITKYPNLVLKRGITDSTLLWQWYQDVVRGMLTRMGIYVMLLDEVGSVIWMWSFIDAYPVRWTGPEMRADSSAVAIEALELAHNGFVRT